AAPIVLAGPIVLAASGGSATASGCWLARRSAGPESTGSVSTGRWSEGRPSEGRSSEGRSPAGLSSAGRSPVRRSGRGSAGCRSAGRASGGGATGSTGQLARRLARREEWRRQRVRWRRTGGAQHAPGVVAVERGEVETAGDPVHVQEGHLVRPPGEADGDGRDAAEDGMPLPCRQRPGGQQVVVAEDEARPDGVGGAYGVLEAHHRRGLQAETGEEAGEVIAEIRMTANAECTHAVRSPGRREWQSSTHTSP